MIRGFRVSNWLSCSSVKEPFETENRIHSRPAGNPIRAPTHTTIEEKKSDKSSGKAKKSAVLHRRNSISDGLPMGGSCCSWWSLRDTLLTNVYSCKRARRPGSDFIDIWSGSGCLDNRTRSETFIEHGKQEVQSVLSADYYGYYQLINVINIIIIIIIIIIIKVIII